MPLALQTWATALFFAVWGTLLVLGIPAIAAYFVWLRRAGYPVNKTAYSAARQRLSHPDPDPHVETSRTWALRGLRTMQLAAPFALAAVVLVIVLGR
jgi:hypothetical protein